jgi:hypothetical protein
MHPELDRQKDAVMKIPRRPAIHLCQSLAPFSPCGPLPNPRRALGYDVAAFSPVAAIRLERAAGWRAFRSDDWRGNASRGVMGGRRSHLLQNMAQ